MTVWDAYILLVMWYIPGSILHSIRISRRYWQEQLWDKKDRHESI